MANNHSILLCGLDRLGETYTGGNGTTYVITGVILWDGEPSFMLEDIETRDTDILPIKPVTV